MRYEVVNGRHTMTYDSVKDIRDTVDKNHRDCYVYRDIESRGGFFALEDPSVDKIIDMSREGWEKDIDVLTNVAENTLAAVEREFDTPSWQSHYDVTGSDVDVARYLSGQPENMIAYTMQPTPKAGRVVTLVVNIGASWDISQEAIETRGKEIVALILALEAMNIRTEVYADQPFKGRYSSKSKGVTTVKVKDATDTLDPAMVMFTLAHPAFLRGVVLPSMHNFPEKIHEDLGVGVGGGYGSPEQTFDASRFPDGAVSVGGAMRGMREEFTPEGVKDFVVSNLKSLGLID